MKKEIKTLTENLKRYAEKNKIPMVFAIMPESGKVSVLLSGGNEYDISYQIVMMIQFYCKKFGVDKKYFIEAIEKFVE